MRGFPGVMNVKGRRKKKTNKWLLIERYRFEARSALNARKSAGLHLDKAVISGTDLEPIGFLAGRQQ